MWLGVGHKIGRMFALLCPGSQTGSQTDRGKPAAPCSSTAVGGAQSPVSLSVRATLAARDAGSARRFPAAGSGATDVGDGAQIDLSGAMGTACRPARFGGRTLIHRHHLVSGSRLAALSRSRARGREEFHCLAVRTNYHRPLSRPLLPEIRTVHKFCTGRQWPRGLRVSHDLLRGNHGTGRRLCLPAAGQR